MRSRTTLMSKEVPTRSSIVVVAAALMAVALPVTVLFSRESHASSETVERAEVALAVPAYSIAPSSAASGVVGAPEWTGDISQSASMVLVGSLLIGLGSIVRRSV